MKGLRDFEVDAFNSLKYSSALIMVIVPFIIEPNSVMACADIDIDQTIISLNCIEADLRAAIPLTAIVCILPMSKVYVHLFTLIKALSDEKTRNMRSL